MNRENIARALMRHPSVAELNLRKRTILAALVLESEEVDKQGRIVVRQSCARISDVAGIPESTVRKNIHRLEIDGVIKKLRRQGCANPSTITILMRP